MSNPPDEFICPISYDIMRDPVICSDGQTYDRPSIQQWLATGHITSPLTNARISGTGLQPNFALKSLIETWLAKNGGAVATKQSSTVTKEFEVSAELGDSAVAVTVETKATTPMESVTIAVLDVSGSMGSASSRTTGEGGVMLSRLDLVKHCMRTYAALLAKRFDVVPSRLSILSFSDKATTLLPVTEMSAGGLSRANDVIDGLSPSGCTNIWDGLRGAIEQAKAAHARWPNANIHIVLLTDGEPTPDYTPLRGIAETLEKRLASIGIHVTVSSFGFGTSLDTNLLDQICTVGGGSYGYISDCSMAGTIFINYAASVLSTAASNVCVKVGDTVMPLGSIQCSGKRSFLVPREAWSDDCMRATVDYDQGMISSVSVTMSEGLCTDELLRKKLYDAVRALRHGYTRPLSEVQSWIQVAASQPMTPFTQAVLEDIEHSHPHKGQLTKAVASDAVYRAWGHNHIVSYARALLLQQCVNFKDAALQGFGEALFQEIVEQGNEIFEDIPPPVPSIRNSNYNSGPISYSMAQFNTADGGCWAGWCKVKMDNGLWKNTHQLRAGDIVDGGHRILCVVRTATEKPTLMMSNEVLSITPWHPIRLPFASTPTWVFPCEWDHAGLERRTEFNHYVYNLVLESGHYVRIGNYEVCTLGHGFDDDAVIAHPYFGTYRVIEHLKQKHGWHEGLVTLRPEDQVRGDDGLVSGI